MNKKDLFKEYPFLKLCVEMAKDYKTLTNGLYKSDDGNYAIYKLNIKSSNTPFRVSHASKIVEINDNLTDSFSFSVILFGLVWCFCKVYPNYEPDDVKVDAVAFNIIAQLPEVNRKEALIDFIKILKNNSNIESNKKRVQKLLEIYKSNAQMQLLWKKIYNPLGVLCVAILYIILCPILFLISFKNLFKKAIGYKSKLEKKAEEEARLFEESKKQSEEFMKTEGFINPNVETYPESINP